jgi:hypothetical protein
VHRREANGGGTLPPSHRNRLRSFSAVATRSGSRGRGWS